MLFNWIIKNYKQNNNTVASRNDALDGPMLHWPSYSAVYMSKPCQRGQHKLCLFFLENEYSNLLVSFPLITVDWVHLNEVMDWSITLHPTEQTEGCIIWESLPRKPQLTRLLDKVSLTAATIALIDEFKLSAIKKRARQLILAALATQTEPLYKLSFARKFLFTFPAFLHQGGKFYNSISPA